MAETRLYVKKFLQEGDIANEYQPLRNKLLQNGEVDYFSTEELDVDLRNPVSIECQPSYDGTVNLILNDDKNPPRIVNTRFTTLENNRYKIINRNQTSQTNLYEENKIDSQTRLFRNINSIPIINLTSVGYYGQLKGGNYTIYMKYGDNDYNQTDIVAESGMISIFKGTLTDINSISGTLEDEITDKVINLMITNVDRSFSNIYLYFVRETSDLNGINKTSAYKLVKSYKIDSSNMLISINGFEEIEEINLEELNIQYNICTGVKTQAQVQNMLFFGNIKQQDIDNAELQNISYYIEAECNQGENIGYIDQNYKKRFNDDVGQTEYYNPLQIYYKLGYWPDEIYRMGVVYIFKDDSLSSVYNLRGCKFSESRIKNFEYGSGLEYSKYIENDTINYLPKEDFLQTRFLDNTKGVFRTPDYLVQNDVTTNTNPIYLKFTFNSDLITALKKQNVKGYFFVRQKRIPITLAQGFSIGVDATSYCPMIFEGNKETGSYICESFISSQKTLSTNYTDRKITSSISQSSGLICLDANLNPTLQSIFDNSKFTTDIRKSFIVSQSENNVRSYVLNSPTFTTSGIQNINLLYVGSDIPFKYANDVGFSTRVGTAEDVKKFGFLGDKNYDSSNYNLVRGIFTPFLGTNSYLTDSSIYNIKINNYSSIYEQEYFKIRAIDNSSFFAISDRYELPTNIVDVSTPEIYRGDCYTCTVTVRMQRNFVDTDVPTNDIIVDVNTWKDNYKGYTSTSEEEWLNINRADINTVPIGTWLTYKCLSNYNLGIRSEDRSNVDEQALMGNPRSFYPLASMSVNSANKIDESWIHNQGYSTTLGEKRNIILPDVPYLKDFFDNRIMFSNVQVDDDFRNAYRIFQGLSYKDIDRQYGAIVKLIPWGVNLFCVFEHGLAIVPINEKALISTNTGQSIHMYGAGVLQNQVTLISPDYGSIWKDSIIRTPTGIYGVDTYAKKIWKYSNNNGLELISDMKIQRFLNDNIVLDELDKYPIVGMRNVKSHYNNYKGDVMFTFYNEDEKPWHMCYNERLNRWITQFSWIPLFSENINNIFYSLDQKRAKLLSVVYNNQFTEAGMIIQDQKDTSPDYSTCGNIWNDSNSNFIANINYSGYDFYDSFDVKITKITTSYLDNDGNEIFEEYTENLNSIATISSLEGDVKNQLQIYSELFKDRFYVKLDLEITPIVNITTSKYKELTEEGLINVVSGGTFTNEIVILKNRKTLSDENKTKYDDLLKNAFYVHGKAGIFDQIDTTDLDRTNQILPTKWYDKQEPFEFEFVVNNIVGIHKIFNDLVIISNNVQPDSIEFEIIGDVYDFNKQGLYNNIVFNEDEFENNNTSQEFKDNVRIVHDHVLNQYSLVTNQITKNVEDKQYGRLRGNIMYKEDKWNLVIEPIRYKKKYKDGDNILISDSYHSAKIRDKFLKVRVKYTGEDISIITALKTLMVISYS